MDTEHGRGFANDLAELTLEPLRDRQALQFLLSREGILKLIEVHKFA